MGHGSVVISDFIKYCHAEALAEGLDFYVSPTIQPHAVNIIMDGLKDDFQSRLVSNRKKSKRDNTSILFIQTEIVRGNSFNSGYIEMKEQADLITHMYEYKDYWDDRFLKFNQILPFVDHVACMHHLSKEYLQSKGYDQTSLIPLRYHETYQHTCHQYSYHRQPFDVLFTGSLTQHRAAVLNKLVNDGLKALSYSTLNSDDTRVSTALSSKIYLGLKHSIMTPQASVMRIYWALMNEIFAMHEHTTEPNELEPYYLTFKQTSDIYAARNLSLPDRQTIALDLKADFRNRSTPEHTLGQTLKRLAQS